jgi:uncharacterized protein DUF6941
MAGCTVLAFLFCDRPSIDAAGKTRLDGIFDVILMPRIPAEEPTVVYVYYKAAVGRPCTLSMKVCDPANGEITGSWSDRIERPGLFQSVWSVSTALFKQPGAYRFELWRDSSECLVTADLAVKNAGP